MSYPVKTHFFYRPLAALAVALFLLACDHTSSTGPSPAQQSVSAVATGVQVDAHWPISSPLSPDPREPFGVPICAHDVAGHTMVRHYAGFDIDYDDRILAPRWTAYKLASAAVRTNREIERDAKFWGDPAIEDAGLRITAHADYMNPKGVHTWDRGHLVPFNDARCWGAPAAHDSFVTANIVPQDKVLNEQAWAMLERRVDAYAKLKGTIWVFTGPIYDKPLHAFAPHLAVPAPDRLFKVVVWREVDDKVGSVAWIMPNTALGKSTDLDKYMVPMAEVERTAGVKLLPGR